MSTYISLDNLARYDLKAKARAESLYADASAACWQKTEKAGAVTCVPAPETPLEPVVEFLFKETLPEGTKGPENPSVIEGVSSVGVADRSKNIYDFPNLSAGPYNGVTITCDADGTITLNGTCNLSSSQSKELYYTYPVAIKTISQINVIASIYHAGGAYDISGSDFDTPVLVQVIRQSLTTGSFGYIWLKDTGTDQTSTQSWIVSNVALITCSLRFFGGAVYNNYKIKVQYEINSDSTVPSSYEPPARDAFAVISLPSTFYGGTLDVASGRLTVTHRMVEPSSGTVDISDRPALLPLEYTDTYGRTVTSDGNTLSVGSSGGQIVYRLANPYTVYVDPTPIDSLPALGRTSPRINTVYTDALNVQVGYAEHPAYTEELINNAILALGGNI